MRDAEGVVGRGRDAGGKGREADEGREARDGEAERGYAVRWQIGRGQRGRGRKGGGGEGEKYATSDQND